MRKYQGSLIVVAAPSGGGKTSLIRKLLGSLKNIEVSISHTTRQPRPREVNGKDYFFVDNQVFDKMVTGGEFIEYARVFDHQYGTSKQEIISKLNAGIDVLLDIDWQGAEQIKANFQDDVVTIFILPPTVETLRSRLMLRQQDCEEVIQSRMLEAHNEMLHYSLFDYVIFNDNFDKAAFDLTCIVQANRLKRERQEKVYAKSLSLLLAEQ